MSTTNAVISRTEITAAANQLEPLPAALNRLLSLMTDDNFEVSAIAEILSHDPALAGDVLNRANSIASGAVRHIGDLREAATRIGSREIVSIAMRRAMRSRFAVSLPPYGLDADELWRHSIGASVAAEVIRSTASNRIPPMIATAALIHDVGKLVVAECLDTAQQGLLLDVANNDGIEIFEAERVVLGIDHGEIGAVVARTWGLPVSVQIALTQHHDPDTDDVFTHALVLADRLSHSAETLRAVRQDNTTSPEEAHEVVAATRQDVDRSMAICGLRTSQLGPLVEQIDNATGEILASYS